MCTLENYLDKFNNNKINKDIYENYELFGYYNRDIFVDDLDFLLKYVYNIDLIDNKNTRLNQKELNTM